jgi:hypothetical protein
MVGWPLGDLLTISAYGRRLCSFSAARLVQEWILTWSRHSTLRFRASAPDVMVWHTHNCTCLQCLSRTHPICQLPTAIAVA